MVSLDDPKKNAEFSQSLEGNFPILSDPQKQAAEAYGVFALGGLFAKRWTFYIDRDGIIRAIDKNVKTSSAGPDMVKQIKALGLSK